MHNNYYFLRQLSISLEAKLSGSVISECFSQNKDELIIRFETSSKPFFIRSSLEPGFCCLSFPDDFHRARKNSVDLFEEIIGRRVMQITSFRNERSFALVLSENHTLVFKMHGNRANLILFEMNIVKRVFKNNIEADKEIALESLNREIDFSRPAFDAHIDNLKTLYFTFGKVVWKYLEHLNFKDLSPDQKWITIQKIVTELENPDYYIVEIEKAPVFSLIKLGTILKEFGDPIAAVNDFFYTFIQSHAFRHEKERSLSEIRAKIRGGQSYLDKTESKLKEIETDVSYKTWADLLMANLHAIKPGSEKVTLNDFISDKPVEIKLKRDLSAQKNAEIFYKKSKNQHIEIQHLQKVIADKKKEIETLQNQINAIELAPDLKQLRSSDGNRQASEKKEKNNTPLPYFEFEFKGFRIWVGKNAQSNDILTLKHSYKEDLWLHAKDVAGSHVLVKHQSGKNFPKDVIERAAQLAAYHSKRKNESLCPVIVTPKKYVRKRKGDPAGMVVVEREEVMLVNPLK